MKIQIKRYGDVTVIDGDESKFNEMVNIHGASNVVNLDAEIVALDYPEPEDHAVVVPPVAPVAGDPALDVPVVSDIVEPVPADPEPVVTDPNAAQDPVAEPAKE